MIVLGINTPKIKLELKYKKNIMFRIRTILQNYNKKSDCERVATIVA